MLYGGTCVVLFYTLLCMYLVSIGFGFINDNSLTIQGHRGSGNEGRKFGKSKHGELRTGKQGMEGGEGKEWCQILNQDIQLCFFLPPFSDSAAAKIHEKSNGVEVTHHSESQENEGQERTPKGHKAPATTPTPPPPPPTQSQLPSLPQQPPPPSKFMFPGKVNLWF